MSAAQSPDKDLLWIIDSDMFPFQSSLVESHVSHMIHTLESHDCIYLFSKGESPP